MSFKPPVIKSFRPFLPSRDFSTSKKFYQHLGFSLESEWPGGAVLSLGESTFILTDFYVEQFASNFMMQLVVPNLDEWWEHIRAANLEETFHVKAPMAPKKQPWGLIVAHFFDPSGVLWHVTSGTSE